MLDRVNHQMSTYRGDSELSRFNQMREGSMQVSKGTAFVVAEALRLYRQTDGLDISVGPIVICGALVRRIGRCSAR